MSEAESKILTRFNIKPADAPVGISGRVKSFCPDDRQNSNTCHDIQVELMDADGHYVSVYNPEAIKQNSEIEEGDDVYLSPEFFLSVSNACSVFPGQIYPYTAELPKTKELLNSEALIELCYNRIVLKREVASSDDSFTMCVKQARHDPKDHSFQPDQAPHLQDPENIYFDASQDGKGYYGLPKKYLIRAGENVVTPEAKAILEEFSRKYMDDGYFTIVRARKFKEKPPPKNKLMEMFKNGWRGADENTPQDKREEMGRRPMQDKAGF